MAYAPPDYDPYSFDPTPAAIPRRVSIFRRVVAWGGVIAFIMLITVCAFVVAGQMVFVVMAQ